MADGNKPTDQGAMAGVVAGFDIPDPTSVPSIKGNVSDEEWAIRCDLAATYRLIALHGWDDLVFTHISARLPDEGGEARFLLNPYGVMFDEMTASTLLKVDMDGNIVNQSAYFSNPAGFTIHSAVHMHRHDAACVIHVHSPHGVAVSAQKGGLRNYSQFSMIVKNDIAYHDYEGVALDLDERERIVADLGEKNTMILRNHGTLTCGATCGIAFNRMYFLERACQVQILAQAGAADGGLIEEPDSMADLAGQQGAPGFMAGMGDNLVWPGLMRRLRRENPGFDQ